METYGTKLLQLGPGDNTESSVDNLEVDQLMNANDWKEIYREPLSNYISTLRKTTLNDFKGQSVAFNVMGGKVISEESVIVPTERLGRFVGLDLMLAQEETGRSCDLIENAKSSQMISSELLLAFGLATHFGQFAADMEEIENLTIPDLEVITQIMSIYTHGPLGKLINDIVYKLWSQAPVTKVKKIADMEYQFFFLFSPQLIIDLAISKNYYYPTLVGVPNARQ